MSVIQHAIRSEIAGQSFYRDAALHCIDPWTKETFATLAQEEDVHTQLLLVEYESLATQGRWLDLEAAWARTDEVDITRFTFPDDGSADLLFPPQRPAGAAIDRRASDLEALAFAIQLEQKAIEMYSSGRATEDPAAQSAYDFLVQEETRHYHQLKDQWEKVAGQPFDGA